MQEFEFSCDNPSPNILIQQKNSDVAELIRIIFFLNYLFVSSFILHQFHNILDNINVIEKHYKSHSVKILSA